MGFETLQFLLKDGNQCDDAFDDIVSEEGYMYVYVCMCVYIYIYI